MLLALDALNVKLKEGYSKPVTLLMGGGGAMILAHQFPYGTTDIDAIPLGPLPLGLLDHFVKEIAKDQGLPIDWLNPYFTTFAFSLPSDYSQRLVNVFASDFLKVKALGKEDMLIMKCFAHRQKDVGHARMLVKKEADLDLVQRRINECLSQRLPQAEKAQKFFDHILELEEK